MKFSTIVQIRWSDLDPNFHVRHSAYYDWGAQQRVDALNEVGLTMAYMKKNFIGPILFREECVFRKEVRPGDTVTIELFMKSCNEDASRWSMAHVLTNQNGELCATITVDGAWIDMSKRKLANPVPQEIIEAMVSFPRLEN